MRAFLTTPLFCMTLTIGTFLIGSAVSKRTGSPLANPLLLAAMQIWIFLSVTKTPVAQYYAGTEMIRFLIVPATAVLGVSIYKNLARIQKNLIPVLGGCAVGAVTAVTSIVLLCRAFGLSREITVALAPKSVTMAIATSVSEQYGGLVPLTVFGVVVTGSIGAILAPLLIRLFRVKDPVEAGLAIGACSHAVGTSTAVKLGETEGAMSGAAIGLCGIATVLLALLFPYVLR